MASSRGKLLVALALERKRNDTVREDMETSEAVRNIELEMDKDQISHRLLQTDRIVQDNNQADEPPDFNNNGFSHEFDSFDEEDKFYDYDDDVKDPDWTLKRKRDQYSSDSDSSESIGTLTTTFMTADNIERNSKSERIAVEENATVTEINSELQAVDEHSSQTEINSEHLAVDDTSNPVLDVIDHEEVVQDRAASTFLQNQTLRIQGKAYAGYRKDEKDGKFRYCSDQSERKMHERCCTSRCEKGWGGRQCNQVPDESRRVIFESFWKNMSWDEKKVYGISLVSKKPVSRRTNLENASRRKYSYDYSLRIKNQKYSVCKSLFLATLSLKEDTVYNWVAGAEEHGFPNPSQQKACTPNAKPKAREFASEFFKDIPKMPSHYCRAQSSKLY